MGKKEPIIILSKGEVIDYQTMIEEVIGPELSKFMPLDQNWDNKNIVFGEKVVDNERAYFGGDADYELIIRKKRN